MTAPLHDLWTRVERGHLPELRRLTLADLHDDAIRAATCVALAGLGTDRLEALLDLRDDLASGAVDGWADAWAQELI